MTDSDGSGRSLEELLATDPDDSDGPDPDRERSRITRRRIAVVGAILLLLYLSPVLNVGLASTEVTLTHEGSTEAHYVGGISQEGDRLDRRTATLAPGESMVLGTLATEGEYWAYANGYDQAPPAGSVEDSVVRGSNSHVAGCSGVVYVSEDGGPGAHVVDASPECVVVTDDGGLFVQINLGLTTVELV